MKKKIIALTLSLFVFFSFIHITAAALVPGDVDANGKTEATDARLALRAAVGLDVLSEAEKNAADVDLNKTVDATDARLILRAAVGLEKLPESPGLDDAPESAEYDILRSGTFYMVGTMIDSTGTESPMEIAITPDSIYMMSDFGGVDMGMLIRNKKVYMICPEKKAYLEMSDSLMSMAGIDISELTASDSLDFSTYGDLSEADSVTVATHNGRECMVYHFLSETEESRIYIDDTKIVRLASYDNNGRFLSATDITAISGDIPAGMSTPPSGFRAYKGMTGMLSFMSLLEDVLV